MRDGQGEVWKVAAAALISFLLGIAVVLSGWVLTELREVKVQQASLLAQIAAVEGGYKALFDRVGVTDAATIRKERR